MIATRDLRVDYGAVTAVHGLDLEISEGEIFGLIGPNGAGKTSTIRVLATLLEPTYGDVLIGGHDVAEEPEEARALLGYMPDWAPVHDDLKVWEFMDFFACAHGLPPADRKRRIAACLDLVELSSKRNEFARNLSRGMKQRLVLAKTLLHEPRVLLLDEPASGLDPRARIELREILKELVGRGRTVLVSSHILTELADFCTAVGIMEKGRMVVSGKVDEIVRRLTPRKELIVEILEQDERALEIIRSDPRVSDVSGERFLEVSFDGDDEDASRLLARLVSSGVKVKAFHERRPDLEDIFMRIGAREVS